MIKFKKQLPKKFSFSGFEVEYASGKKKEFSKAKSKVQESEKEIVFTFELKEYLARATFSFVDKNAVEMQTVFFPKGEVKDKIRKIISLKLFAKQSQKAIFLKKKFTDTGFCARKEMEKDGISEDFVAFFEKEKLSNNFTLTAKMCAKFYSCAKYSQNKKGVAISVETTVPKSFSGIVESEPWVLRFGEEVYSSLEKSIDEYKQSDTFSKPVGWSTWDYYFTDATEEDVKKNVDFICKDKVLKEKIRYVALDDGWQQREGDWKSGIRYPSGLKSLVQYIKEKGLEAGIWIAPTRLHYLCATVMRRNDFLIRNDYGDPIMDEDMYVLDPTHPDGEKFLRETFAYLKDCGFTFFKLDFVSNLLKADRFYDKSAGHYDALKKLFALARECLGEDSHIMGCSLPYLIGKDVADSRRSGLDIHNTYKHLKKCTEIALYQLPSNERVHRLDLDYLVVRGKETSDDDKTNVLNPKIGEYLQNPAKEFRWRDGEDFSYTEAKVWCSIMLMSGSSVFLGDNLTKLNSKGLSLVKKVLENVDFHSAKPVCWKEEGLPEVWEKENYLYFFNFGEKSKKYITDAKNGEYIDLFEDKKYSVQNGTLKLKIEPHDCVCLKKIK